MSIQNLLTEKLQNEFHPIHCEVLNESHMHHVPPHSETHFKVILVSQKFLNQSKIKRHQSVYHLASQWMNQPIHALSLHLFTESEWEVFQNKNLDSPRCHGNE